jgi:hypothetical protein
MVDRDKNWRLSREEFRKAIQEVGSKRNKTKHN